MKKLYAAAFLLVFLGGMAFAQAEVTGHWKTIDDTTGKPKSIMALYTKGNNLYGRVIMSYEDDGSTIKDDIYRQLHRSPYMEGSPAFCGLDIIWDMSWDKGKEKWRGGTIMDPGNKEKKPKTYGCEIWREGADLIVRGKIAFIGRNQTWKRFDPKDFPPGFNVPDSASFTPVIPVIK